MIPCPDLATWEQLSDGATPPGDAERLRAHLSTCAACRVAYDRVSANQRLLDPLRAAVGPEGLPKAPEPGSPRRAGGSLGDGDTVGEYRIIRRIGGGGMGEVYLAVREGRDYTRQVAIKVLRPGLNTEGLLRRFRVEQQVLASLTHPNIARLYGGGQTDDGRPYFAMEYVEGRSLDRYADLHRLTIPQRLRLFRKVCSAVHHAHRNLVVHRDLKPSNVLVTEDGEPKLLDFGIAKLVNPSLSVILADPTTVGRAMMTPEYASPEQVRGDPISTASDVYSLGVMLYRIVSGHRPYQITRHVAMEIERVICVEAPEKPSTAAGRSEELLLGPDPGGGTTSITPETVSELRETRPDRLRRTLTGDIDNIVMMAMRKEPQRRYASAEQLAEDIDRHLRGRPIIAAPDTVRYRCGKFVRRNRIGVAAAAAVALSLVGGTVGTASGWQAAEVREQEAWDVVGAIRPLMDTLLGDVHDEIARYPGATSARLMLIETAKDYLARLEHLARGNEDHVLYTARTYEKLAEVQGGIRNPGDGDIESALASAGTALGILEDLRATSGDGPRIRSALSRNHRLHGDLFYADERAAESLASYRRALELRQPLYDDDPSDANRRSVASLLLDIGTALSLSRNEADAARHYDEALPHLEALARQDPDDDDRQRALSVTYLRTGAAYERADDHEAGLERFEQAVAIRGALLEREPESMRAQADLGIALAHAGQCLHRLEVPDRERGDLLLAEAIERLERPIRENPETIDRRSRYRVALVLQIVGDAEMESDPDAARRRYELAMEIMEPMVADVGGGRNTRRLGTLYLRLAQVAQAGANWPEVRRRITQARQQLEPLLVASPENDRLRELLALMDEIEAGIPRG